jgi:hypothetical protein
MVDSTGLFAGISRGIGLTRKRATLATEQENPIPLETFEVDSWELIDARHPHGRGQGPEQ